MRIPRPASLAILWIAALGVAWSCGGEPRGGWREAQPHPRLGPDEVVAAQLEAFRNNDPQDTGIEVAFRFSSPDNRANTGPIERFASMIHEGPYELLLGFDGVSTQPVERRARDAHQTVTIVRDGQSRRYHFHLSKQREGDCADCWMTDAVLVEEAVGEAI